jgi:hypothetical protein
LKFKQLTKENIKLYAASVYDNPGCSSLLEFEEDYLRVKYIKSLINKYINNKSINIRILINHIICLSNVFPGPGSSIILFTEMDESTWGVLATLLIYLSLMPNTIENVNGKTIKAATISFDENLLEYLRGL